MHPQSVIHSLVEYVDGSVLAQLGNPDMRTPIAYALAWPDRINAGVKRLDLFEVAQLDFESPDLDRFPCLKLACDAMKIGGTSTAILNAANEIAVAEFLNGRIRFTSIAEVVEATLNNVTSNEISTLDDVMAADLTAREYAQSIIKELAA